MGAGNSAKYVATPRLARCRRSPGESVPRVLGNWAIRVNLDDALRGQSADPRVLGVRNPGLVRATAAILEEGQTLFEPVVVYRDMPITGRGVDRLELEAESLHCGSHLARRLEDARRLILLACSIGPRLETRVSELFGDDPIGAVALDGLGNAAVEALASEACAYFTKCGQPELAGATSCWPGCAGWPVTLALTQLFGLLHGTQPVDCPVRLLPSAMMWPVKSVAFALGLTPAPRDDRLECGRCSIRPTCRYAATRRAPASPTREIASEFEVRSRFMREPEGTVP